MIVQMMMICYRKHSSESVLMSLYECIAYWNQSSSFHLIETRALIHILIHSHKHFILVWYRRSAGAGYLYLHTAYWMSECGWMQWINRGARQRKGQNNVIFTQWRRVQNVLLYQAVAWKLNRQCNKTTRKKPTSTCTDTTIQSSHMPRAREKSNSESQL